MQALRRIFATLLVAIVVVLLFGGTTYVAQRYLPKPPEASKPKLPAPRVLDLEAVEKVLDLLQANYIHPIDETKLGMRLKRPETLLEPLRRRALEDRKKHA